MPAFDPAEIGHGGVYRIMIGSIVPRPIAWISTMDVDGRLNLAPFSFFNVACTWPPVLSTSIGRRGRDKKDTWCNIEATGEYVVNIVNETVEEQMNLTSGEYTADVDEFALTGLTPIPSLVVKPPSLAEAPVQFECKLHQIVEIGEPGRTQGLVLGRIVMIRVADEIMDGNKIDPLKLRTVGRMGGMQYTRTREIFTMIRPGMTE